VALTARRRPRRHPGADRGAPSRPASWRRLLVVRADNLGDVVMATPALHALRRWLPHARIELLASPAGAAAAPLLADVDAVLAVSASWQRLGGRADPLAEHGLVARLQRRRFDAMVVLTSPTQSPWPAAVLGLLAGIGVRAVQSAEFGGAVATHLVSPPPARTHQVDRDLHLVQALGCPRVDTRLRLAVPPAARARARALAPGSYALVLPGASCSSRRYPPARFGAVAARIAAHGLPVLVAGAAGEQDRVADVVAAAAHPDVGALPPVPVPVFAALVERARVAVTNNSAGMHVADAVETPVAVAYGGSERLTDMPARHVRTALLRVPTTCSPCRQLSCPYDEDIPTCLDLPAERLAAAALGLADHQEVPWTARSTPCPD